MAEDTDHRESRNKPGFLLLCVTVTFLIVIEASTNSLQPWLSPAKNWWAARDYCSNNNCDMFIPQRGSRLSSLREQTFYWVGAFETFEWKWTDNSTLLSHYGYLANDDLKQNVKTYKVDGNSVALCYSICFPMKYIGLSETRCYCLRYPQISVNSRTEEENPCPGNVADKCGNASGMSVYKSDINLGNSQKGGCALAVWGYTWRWQQKYLHFTTENCSLEMPSFCKSCNDNRCRYHKRELSTWTYANSQCNLAKVTNKNKKSFFRIKTQGKWYWIGLYRDVRKVWNNGREIDRIYGGFGHTYPRCLALWYRYDSWKLYWMPCHNTFEALCVTRNTISKKTTSTERGASRQPLPLTETTTMTDIVKTTSELPTSTSINVKTTIDKQQETKDVLKGETEEINNAYGLYIGTGLGVLLLTILITFVLVVLIRKEKFCFNKEQRTIVQFQAGTENVTYDSGPQERHPAPSCMTLEAGGQATSAQADPNKVDTVSDLYSKVDKPERKSAKEDQEHSKKETVNIDSNQGFDDQDVYNKAGACCNFEVVENFYNHLNIDGENDYDIAGCKPDIDRWDSTYNHLDSVGVNTEESTEQHKDGDTDYYNIESTATRK